MPDLDDTGAFGRLPATWRDDLIDAPLQMSPYAQVRIFIHALPVTLLCRSRWRIRQHVRCGTVDMVEVVSRDYRYCEWLNYQQVQQVMEREED